MVGHSHFCPYIVDITGSWSDRVTWISLVAILVSLILILAVIKGSSNQLVHENVLSELLKMVPMYSKNLQFYTQIPLVKDIVVCYGIVHVWERVSLVTVRCKLWRQPLAKFVEHFLGAVSHIFLYNETHQNISKDNHVYLELITYLNDLVWLSGIRPGRGIEIAAQNYQVRVGFLDVGVHELFNLEHDKKQMCVENKFSVKQGNYAACFQVRL